MSLVKADQSETLFKITARHGLALKLDLEKLSLEEAHVWGICSLRSSFLARYILQIASKYQKKDRSEGLGLSFGSATHPQSCTRIPL